MPRRTSLSTSPGSLARLAVRSGFQSHQGWRSSCLTKSPAAPPGPPRRPPPRHPTTPRSRPAAGGRGSRRRRPPRRRLRVRRRRQCPSWAKWRRSSPRPFFAPTAPRVRAAPSTARAGGGRPHSTKSRIAWPRPAAPAPHAVPRRPRRWRPRGGVHRQGVGTALHAAARRRLRGEGAIVALFFVSGARMGLTGAWSRALQPAVRKR
mmetsp:Transcript_140879/g.450404  ORF Transcript_140879/g.450404 Transcript_140879/m.450404 type:complete len:206 (+) Transcript_140879:495-1112(+)